MIELLKMFQHDAVEARAVLYISQDNHKHLGGRDDERR